MAKMDVRIITVNRETDALHNWLKDSRAIGNVS